MTRAAPRTLHRLMALLTVLAAFAFQVRADGSMPGWWASAAAGAAAPVSSPGPAHQHAHHGAPVAGTSPPPSAPSIPQSEHQHGAHCPFCVTNAFALNSLPAQAPAAPEWATAPQVRWRPVPVVAPRSQVRARAPPALF